VPHFVIILPPSLVVCERLLCFISLILNHPFNWTCALDFSLLRCASVLYAPQSLYARAQSVCQWASTHSDSPSPLLALPSPASCRLTGHRPVHAAPLRTYHSAVGSYRFCYHFLWTIRHYVFNVFNVFKLRLHSRIIIRLVPVSYLSCCSQH
jgi:hypothetical protein